MRIQLTLTPTSYPAIMPLNHHQLAAFIYETVAVAAPDFANFLHEEGWRPDQLTDHRFKFFVFSLPDVPRFTFQPNGKSFTEGVVWWQISSPLPEFIEAFIVGLGTRREVRIGQSHFTVSQVDLIPHPDFASPMRFMALSPLMVSTTEADTAGRRIKRYVRADEALFGELVATNLRAKYQALYGTEPEDPTLEFMFDPKYLAEAGGAESRKVTRLIQYKETKIKSVLAPFLVQGNSQLIQLGWESGFGSANSQGFGMAGL
jgi:CRISPR-associated endoribonuclease Cas6